jgi:hypothetical protein
VAKSAHGGQIPLAGGRAGCYIPLQEMAVSRHYDGSGGETAKAARKTLLRGGFWGRSGFTGIDLMAARKGQSGGQKIVQNK